MTLPIKTYVVNLVLIRKVAIRRSGDRIGFAFIHKHFKTPFHRKGHVKKRRNYLKTRERPYPQTSSPLLLDEKFKHN